MLYFIYVIFAPCQIICVQVWTYPGNLSRMDITGIRSALFDIQLEHKTICYTPIYVKIENQITL